MRWLRGLGALVVLAAVMLGAPIALARWGYLPAGWATLARPDDGSLLLGVLTVVGWLAWAAFSASTLLEVLALATRGGQPWRIPLLARLQQLSAGLILAVLALAPAASAPEPQRVAVLAAHPTSEKAPTPAEAPDEAGTSGTYVVEAGDDLWSVSERTLGDGSRWRDLVAANPEVLKDPTSRLATGTRLVLPASARHPHRVTVERGDTLSGLALEHLGAAGRWPKIAAANRDLIRDPDHIEIGWRLDIPGDPATTRRAAPEPTVPDPGTATGPASTSGTGPKTRTPVLPPPTVPAPSGSAAATTPVAPTPEAPPAAATAESPDPGLPVPGLLGSLAAAAIIGVVEARRFLRLRERPVGRRLVEPDASAVRLRTVLGAGQRPDRLAALDATLRAVGAHCHAQGFPLPELDRITVGEHLITLEWAGSAVAPPPGFSGTVDRWMVELGAPPAPTDHPCPYPAVVSLGSTADGDLVLADVEQSRVLGVSSDDAELRRSSMAAMAVELACAPWSAETTLVVCGADAGLVRLAGGDRVTEVPDAPAAVAWARSLVARRRAALGAASFRELRVDPDRAEAVAPVVLCLLGDTPPGLAADLDDLLAGEPSGVAAILDASAPATARWHVGGNLDQPSGRLTGAPGRLLAHAIPASTRAGVAGLLRAADDSSTTAAPWWSEPAPEGGSDNVVALPQRALLRGDDVDIVRLEPGVVHPQVLLIGPTELRGASGPEPSRSRQQLIELCTWLLEHPGSTATAMATGLGVAEGTRRSNLSRLRAWLGDAPDGSAYLPDAYSGRVLLHPGVTSDWQRLQVLLTPGIDRVGDSTLVAALELVRGAPLADAAPGQWHWAEELRTDVSSALRDVGVVLTDRALARGDIDLARWAASRALVVAAEDEQLVCARIRTEHRAGNASEVERLVNQVARQARLLGVDLLPETAQLCQQVIEGRTRARA